MKIRKLYFSVIQKKITAIGRVRKYAKFGVFYAKSVQMTPLRLRRESLRLQTFSVTNSEPLRLQKFSVTNTVLSLPFLQQIQFTLIVNVVNLNYVIEIKELYCTTKQEEGKQVNYDQSLLDDRHHGFELSRSADRHSYFVYPQDSVYMPGPRAGKSDT